MNKKELLYFLVSIVVLSIVFGFDDGSETFQLSYWLFNLFNVFIIVTICLSAYLGLQKYLAKVREAQIEYRIWTISRLKLKDYYKGDRPKIPLGIILCVLISFVSYGKWFFTAIGTSEINWDKSRRTGRKFTNITEYETALIYLGGPLALSIILFICNWLNLIGIETRMISTISFYILLFNILPIPGVDGSKAFSASKLVYIFFILFIGLNFVLNKVGIFLGAILSLIMAVIILGIYYYKWEK
jgi:hypothetical protein